MNIATEYAIVNTKDQYYRGVQNGEVVFTNALSEVETFKTKQETNEEIKNIKLKNVYLVPRTISEVIFLRVARGLEKYTRENMNQQLHCDDIEEHEMELRFGWVEEDESTFILKVEIKEIKDKKIQIDCFFEDIFNSRQNKTKEIETTIEEIETDLLQTLIDFVKIK